MKVNILFGVINSKSFFFYNINLKRLIPELFDQCKIVN